MGFILSEDKDRQSVWSNDLSGRVALFGILHIILKNFIKITVVIDELIVSYEYLVTNSLSPLSLFPIV